MCIRLILVYLNSYNSSWPSFLVLQSSFITLWVTFSWKFWYHYIKSLVSHKMILVKCFIGAPSRKHRLRDVPSLFLRSLLYFFLSACIAICKVCSLSIVLIKISRYSFRVPWLWFTDIFELSWATTFGWLIWVSSPTGIIDLTPLLKYDRVRRPSAILLPTCT